MFTHITADNYAHDIDAAADTLRAAGIAYWPRTHDDITTMLTGYRLHTPGLISPHRWRPEPFQPGRYDAAIEAHLPFIRDISAYAAIGQTTPDVSRPPVDTSWTSNAAASDPRSGTKPPSHSSPTRSRIRSCYGTSSPTPTSGPTTVGWVAP